MGKTFYRCSICGNLIDMLEDSGRIPVCCGKEMTRLFPGVSDGTMEKHVPVFVTRNNLVSVQVGKQPHPMEKDHFIEWIMVITNKGQYMHRLTPEHKPLTEFAIMDDETVDRVYIYCNKHGLWMAMQT